MSIELLNIDPQLLYINLLSCAPGFSTGYRQFPFSYSLYVHTGKGRITIEDTVYEAKTGDLFFCSPHVRNKIESDKADPFTLSGLISMSTEITRKSPPLRISSHT